MGGGGLHLDCELAKGCGGKGAVRAVPKMENRTCSEEAAAEPRDLGVCDGPSCVPCPPIGVLKS